MDTIKQVLYWFTFGPGAGYLTYRIMNVPAVITWVENIKSVMLTKLGVGERETKRIVTFVISWILSASGYGLMLALGLAGTEDALNTIVSLSGISTVTSQLAHGRELDNKKA